MDEDETLFERYGGYLAVAAIAALMFLGARSLWVSEAFNYEPSSESSSETASAVPIESLSGLDRQIGKGGPSFDIDKVPVLIDRSLSPNLYPQTYRGQTPHHELITYTVQPNDTPIGIADKFGIKPETILGGNAYLSEESSALQAGETLVILPIDGVLHDVGEGETLEDLANLYGVTVDDIIAYEPNRLEFPYRLYPGTEIMIPGGVREVFVWSAPSLPSRPSWHSAAPRYRPVPEPLPSESDPEEAALNKPNLESTPCFLTSSPGIPGYP